jgi:hypothetical protein
MRTSVLVVLGLGCFSAPLLLPQESKGSASSLKPYLGSWKGVCADGKDFVIVVLDQAEDGRIGGTIRLANMRGGEDGRCAIVVDPPDDKHALKVSDGKLTGSALRLNGPRSMEFEMTVTSADAARLKFLGTASEENPWELKRAK